jgi:glycosyltransferase involved in cell wall biosynthesis
MSQNRRKSVLFLIPTLAGGGAERVMVTLLRYLDRSQFDLTLAVIDTRDAVFRSDLPPDIEFIDLGRQRVLHALVPIVRLIWRRRPEVVFCTLGHLNLALALLRPLMPRGPRFVARESNVPSEQLRDERFPRVWHWLYRRIYRRHDLVVCQSRTMLVDLETNFGLLPERSVVIANPVDLDRIRLLAADGSASAPMDDDPGVIRLVAAGRLVPQKGFDLLIEAIALLPDIALQLTILGEGPLRQDLLDLVQRLELEQRVQMVGFQSNPYAWFARADAFVLPSRYEGLPNVVLEALACGTPVIATPAAGVAVEVLQDVAECVLAPQASAKAIAGAIRSWAGGTRRRVPVSAVSAYGIEGIVSQYQRQLGSL